MGKFKWLLVLLAGLLLVLVVAVLTVPLWFDPNDHKDRIVAEVEAVTGRDFSIEGEIELSFFPWLAVAAGPVSLGNDPAFEGSEFLRAERLSAELRLLPLLSGSFEIGEIRIEGPEIYLEVASDGTGNWESLSAAADTSSTDVQLEGESTEPVGATVQSVQIEDGLVNYRDRAAGIEARLSELRLEATPIRADAPIDVELSTRYSFGEYEGAFDAALVARDALSGDGLKAELSRMKLTNTTAPASSLTIDRAATLDLAAGTVALPEFRLESVGARGTGSVQGRGLPADPAFQGSLELSPFNLGEWLEQTGLYVAGTTDPAALDRFEAALDWTMQGDTIRVSKLTGQLDDSRLSGSASLGETTQFEFSIDRINADRYLPPESASAPPPEEPRGDTTLEFGRMQGTLTVGELILAGLTATDVQVRLESDERGLRVLPIEGQLYGGAVNARMDLDTNSGRLTAGADVQQVRGGDLLGAWLSPAPLTGLGDLSAELSVDRPFDPDPLASLNGTVSFDFRDGAVYGFNIMRVLRQVLAATGQGDPADLFSEARDTDFSSLKLRAAIDRGVLSTREFSLVAPYLQVDGAGSIDLTTGQLDYRLTSNLVRAPDAEGGEAYGVLKGTPIPLQVGGSMTDPKVSFDVAKILLATQGSKLDNKLREKLGAEKGDDEESTEDALKSLLGEALKKKLQGDDEDDDDGSL
ncbi:MAG: AsmA family protein [Xanthomonadales bacterium]|nr:AsmA family protein [Xanthomonadales bacterium]